jgi:hypothetical protein
MRRLGASITTLRSTSLRSGWLAVAFTMPARIATNSSQAMPSRCGRLRVGRSGDSLRSLRERTDYSRIHGQRLLVPALSGGLQPSLQESLPATKLSYLLRRLESRLDRASGRG